MRLLNFFYPKTRLFAAMMFILLGFTLTAQQREPLQPKTTKTTAATPPTVIAPFELTTPKTNHNQIVKEATYLKLDANQLKTATNERQFLFKIPQKSGAPLELLLERQEILTPDFKVTNQDGKELNYEAGQFFTGTLLNRNAKTQEASIASLSISGGEVMATISVGSHNLVLGTVRDGQGKSTSEYVFYEDDNLLIPNTFECGTTVEDHLKGDLPTVGTEKAALGKNIVKIYFETDYRMYQDFGYNYSAVVNYVTGLFNMVATIYHNEGIVTQISQVGVWTIADPYPINTSSSSGDVLNKFYTQMNGGFNGNLAHLLSTKPVGHGGIAWINVLCHPTFGYRTAYSNISTSYNNFPLYSWTIDVVTHEMGHNLGSPHTHDCVWGAGSTQALDNCYTPSGGCAAGPAPLNGGTIMSYCHLTSGGKNFNLGFGYEPGNLIRNRVAAATCLSKAFLNCGSATAIHCGDVVNGSTIGTPNNVTYYGCNSWKESGGERVFMLQTTEPGNITVTLSNLTADLDVIILDACSESNCLAEGNDVATVVNASPGMYFIVVDGYYGAAGNFTLSVSCNGYCFATGNTNYEFIQRVQFATIDNNSGNNYGYGDFTALTVPVSPGSDVPVTLTPGFISGAWSERWRMYLDINQDEDFNDWGELVFDSGTASASAASGTMHIPSFANLGKTRLRVVMNFSSAPNDCGTTYGEYEDYSVDIVPYCPSVGNSKYEFIDSIAIGSLTQQSGNNLGYKYFTSPVIDILKGETLPVTLVPGFTDGEWKESWKVWIDFDQDRVFNDSTELVFVSDSATTTAQTGTLTIPADALTGKTRMRISMNYYNPPTQCSYAFWGETEDYDVTILPFCPSGGNSTYEFIDKAGVGSLINDSGNNGGYEDFTDIAFEANVGEAAGVILIPGFAGETTYKEFWRIWVDFNLNQLFEEEEQVFEAGPSDAAVLGAFIIPDVVLPGTYGCRIAMRYSDFPEPCGRFSWGETEDYTLVIKQKEDGGGDLNGDGTGLRSGKSALATNIPTVGDFGIFPNPVQDRLNIDWNGLQPINGQVISQTGQVVLTFGEANVPTQLQVDAMPAGLYLLQVLTADNQLITKKFVKN